MSDQLATILRRNLGNRFEDVRAAMPVHPVMRFSALNTANLKGIAVHHSAGPRDQAPVQIASYHISKPDPFAGIGYHIVIRHGVVYYVGTLATQRAHVAGRNHELAGICVTGDYTQEAPHRDDLDALALTVAALDEVLGRKLPINGHGGWALAGHGTQCPGALTAPAKAIRDGVPATPPEGVSVRTLWIEADGNQTIHLNSKAGLQKAIIAAGQVPTSDEWNHSPRHIAQRGESPTGGGASVWVYDKTTGAVTRHNRS